MYSQLFLTSSSRYNLKRRVASLPTLSSDIFTEKVLTAQASSSAAAAKASYEKSCSACQKTYYSENTFRNHLGSQKHRLRIAALQRGDSSAGGDDTSSVISSTFSLGEPINRVPKENVHVETEPQFSQVVNGIKDTSIHEKETASRICSSAQDSANIESKSTVTAIESRNPSINSKSSALSEDLPMNRCMFCNYDSPTLELSVMHMSKFHGLFIPEQPYLVDLEGLICYLNGKISQLYECLYCHKLKGSVQGIQTHMRDKGHCMIAFESEEEMVEVGQFYDFSSTYSDDEGSSDEEEEYTKRESKELKPLKMVISGSNGEQELREGEENAEGWETDSSASSLYSENLLAVPIDHDHAYEPLPLHKHHSHDDARPHRSADGFHSYAPKHFAVFHADYELHLPSGRTAGHRSLWRYYRQNLHNYPTAAERIQNRLLQDASSTTNTDEERLVSARAQGGTGMVGVTDSRKKEVQAAEKRDRRREERGRQHHQWGVDKRGNAQKHFRDPLLQ